MPSFPISSTTPASSTACVCAKRSGSGIATTTWSHLEEQLQAAAGCRFRMIATDGVFSMDGYLANLPESVPWRISTTRS